MKQVRFLGWVSILILLFISSCREDIIDVDTKTNNPYPEIQVEAAVRGLVTDEDNIPVASALVKVGTEETTTDENGFFRFEKEEFNQNGTLLRVEKQGYYLGVKLFNPTVGKESFVAVQLLRKELVGTFTSTTGGLVSTDDGASVSFAANSIQYENGTAFTGEVQVYAKWIDPTADLLLEQMPGDLRAVDKEGNPVQLATFGMVAVELETASGTALQLVEGSPATLTMPVPAEILGQAPASIPLWSMDETTGNWVEESTATLQGDKYVGEVPHFSFWNCDAPFPLIQLEGQIIDAEGNPIHWAKITIHNDAVGTGGGYTNEEGVFSGKVPKDLPLTIAVYNQCWEIEYEAEIGPYSDDVVLDPIVASSNATSSLTGVLVDCDGAAVENGYVYVTGGPYLLVLDTDENGVFNWTGLLCQEVDLTLKGFDLDASLASDPINLNIPEEGADVDLGNVEVCNAITELIHIEIPELGYEKDMIIYVASYNTANGALSVFSDVDSTYLQMEFEATPNQIGDVDMNNFNFWDPNDPAVANLYFFCQGPNGGGNFGCPVADVTTNEGIGGLFEGSFDAMIGTEGQGGVDEYQVIVEFSVLLQ